MALKDDWKDLVDGVDDASSDSINQIAHAVIDIEKNGSGSGNGQDGGYYKPNVDSNGVLSWQASKASMPSVPSSVVKGKDGYTPIRGIDYWTNDDKTEIKSYVDDAILGGAW